MTEKITIEGEITEDGKLILQLPTNISRGAVKVTIEPSEELMYQYDEELETYLVDDNLSGPDLTMGEIELPDTPTFEDVSDGETYIGQIRKQRRYIW